VQDVVSWNGAQSHWNITFSRSPNDWEEDNVCDFLATLSKINVVPHSIFTIKSFCQKLYGGGNYSGFPIKSIWKSKAPMKVCFFAWALLEEKSQHRMRLKEETLMGLVGVLCVLKRKKWRTISLSIVVGHHLFGICLFP